jgi:ATP-dependent DNA helicase PIF1
MFDRFCFEAFDRTMRDLMRVKGEENLDKPFEGKVVILGEYFRQILHVVRKGYRLDIMKSIINSSILWDSCKVLNIVLKTEPAGWTVNRWCVRFG